MSSTYIVFDKNNNNKDPKFKVGDQVRISKYKSIFPRVTFQIRRKKFLLLLKLKILFHGHISLVILNVKTLLERFTKENCKKKEKKSER